MDARSLKKFLAMIAVTFLLIAQSGLSALQARAETLKNAVTVTIIGYDEKAPVLETVAVPATEGETAFGVLRTVTEAKNIPMEYQLYDGMGAFITKVGNVEPQGSDYWGFFVNGIDPNVGVSSYKVKNGDNLLLKITSYPPETITVKVSAVAADQKEVIPETEVEIVKGGTAYDALVQAAKARKVALDVSVDSRWLTFINDIGGLLDGNGYWEMYMNGKFMDKGLVSYQMQEGDHLQIKAVPFDSGTNPGDGGSDKPADNPADPNPGGGNQNKPGQSLKKEVQTAIERINGYFAKNRNLDWYGILALKALHQPVPETYAEQTAEEAAANGGNYRNVTDLAKAILVLTASGKDAADVAGYNLIEKLANHERMTKQGNNGPIFALLALDSGDYQVPERAKWTREKLVAAILDAQLDNGAWSLFGDSPSSDMTGMALAALSPYTGEKKVKDAVDAAVNWLSKAQADTGGFDEAVNGGEASESIAQVIIGLTANRVDPAGEPFTKPGGSLVRRLLDFQKADGGFAHLPSDETSNPMSTAQAFLALAAYQKYLSGEGSVFQFAGGEKVPVAGVAKPNPADQKTVADGEGKRLPDTAAGHVEVLLSGILLMVLAAALLLRRKKVFKG